MSAVPANDETTKTEITNAISPLPRRSVNLLALDLPLRGTLNLYLLVFALVARYTLLPWYHFAPHESLVRAFFSDWIVNSASLMTAAFIHSLPFQAYAKAKTLDSDLDRERRVAVLLSERARELGGHKSAELDRVGIDNLYSRHFEELVAGQEGSTAAAKILRDVLTRAQMLRFEPAGNLVRPHREELAARLPEIAKYQRVALQLGIMSTFFGLMLVFSGSAFSSSVASGGAGMMAGQLIGGLNLAFGGSVAGLISSIVVILFLDHLRRDLVAVVHLLEQLAEQLTAIAHRAFNDPALRDNLVALESVLRRTEGQLDSVRHELSAATKHSQALQAVVEASNPKITEAAGSISAAMRNLSDQQERLVGVITTAYERLTPSELGDRIYQSLEKGLSETRKQLLATAETISALHEAAAKVEAAHINANATNTDIRRSLRRIEQDVERLQRASGRRPFYRFWSLPWRRRDPVRSHGSSEPIVDGADAKVDKQYLSTTQGAEGASELP